MKRTSRAALANRDAIARALQGVLPPAGKVLELGSGTGEHAVFLAGAFPALEWQPSDPDPAARASIAAWAEEAALPNLRPPLGWDLLLPSWRLLRVDAVLCVNVLHVTPAAAAEALCAGAARVLPRGGPLVVAGPFTGRGAPPGERLARIDAALRAHDPALGVPALEVLLETAGRHGLALARDVPLPEEGDRLLVLRARG